MSIQTSNYYRPEDLNRVETKVQRMRHLAKGLDIHLPLVTKTDWGLPGAFSPDSWPVERQMGRYLSNVRALRDRFAPGVEIPQTMAFLTFEGAWALEKALEKAEKEITGRLNTFHYSGESFAGEEIGV